MPLVMSTECLRELDLVPERFSRVDKDRESGGVLAKTLESRAGVGASLERAFSFLSEDDDLSSPFSAEADFFRELDSFSGLDLDGFFGSLVGVAVHIPHEEEPSRLILGRSFLEDLASAGGEGGESGTAGGGGGAGGGGESSTAWGVAEAFLDFLPDFFCGAMSTTSMISSSSSNG